MDNMKKGTEEAKKLNQQMKNGSASGFISSTDSNSPELQEARQLNSQSGSSASSFSSGISSGSSFSSSLEETKKLNQQSRQNKGK